MILNDIKYVIHMACIIEHTRRPKAIYSSSFLHAYNNLRSDIHQSVNFPNDFY